MILKVLPELWKLVQRQLSAVTSSPVALTQEMEKVLCAWTASNSLLSLSIVWFLVGAKVSDPFSMKVTKKRGF
jgi:hypothetical protein